MKLERNGLKLFKKSSSNWRHHFTWKSRQTETSDWIITFWWPCVPCRVINTDRGIPSRPFVFRRTKFGPFHFHPCWAIQENECRLLASRINFEPVNNLNFQKGSDDCSLNHHFVGNNVNPPWGTNFPWNFDLTINKGMKCRTFHVNSPFIELW